MLTFFNGHASIVIYASHKLNALSGVANYMSIKSALVLSWFRVYPSTTSMDVLWDWSIVIKINPFMSLYTSILNFPNIYFSIN